MQNFCSYYMSKIAEGWGLSDHREQTTERLSPCIKCDVFKYYTPPRDQFSIVKLHLETQYYMCCFWALSLRPMLMACSRFSWIANAPYHLMLSRASHCIIPIAWKQRLQNRIPGIACLMSYVIYLFYFCWVHRIEPWTSQPHANCYLIQASKDLFFFSFFIFCSFS